MIEFLIAAIVLLIIIYVVKLILDAIELPGGVKQIAWIIVGLFVLLWLLKALGLWSGGLTL